VAGRRQSVDLDRLPGGRVRQRDAADSASRHELLDEASAVVNAAGSLFPQESSASTLVDVHDSLTAVIRLLKSLGRCPGGEQCATTSPSMTLRVP
jgi:hypothetical protein